MNKGVIIEGVSREEFMAAMDEIKSIIASKVKRSEYTTHELSELTGYSRSHIRVLIRNLNIPFTRKGKEMVVSQEYVGLFKPKAKTKN